MLIQMKTKTSSLIATAIGLCLVTPALRAQDAQKQPSPEIKKFEAFVGKWSLDEVDEDCPFGPAGIFTCDTEIRFVQNGFAVEERGTGTGASAPFTYATLYFYDPTAHTLKSVYYNSDGLTMLADCTFDGDSLKSAWTQEEKGRRYQCRQIWTVAPDRKTSKYEWTYSEDGSTWKTVCKGTGKKIGDIAKTPGPEHKKMAVWVGDWTYEGESKNSPFGPGGKMKGKESSKMVLDGFVWEDRWQDEPVAGTGGRGIIYLRYDPETKTYIDYSFANDGTFGSTTNTISGNVWTGVGTQTDPSGKIYKTRFVRTLSADGRTGSIKAEYSADGGKSWMTWWEQTSRKVSN